MIIAPLDWNLLPSGTVVTSALAFERGAPASNLFDEDPLKVCTWRGRCVVTAGVDNALAWNDGSARTATIAAGTYYSMHEAGIAAASAMNAVSGTWYAYLDQSNATGWSHHHMVFRKSSGSATIDPTASNSAFRLLFGFRNQARATSGTHYGDFPAVQGRSDAMLVDLASAKSAHGSFLANIRTSPGAQFAVATGSTSSVTDSTDIAGGVFDDEVICMPYSAPRYARYVRLTTTDHWRKDFLRMSLGYWYHGPWYNTENASNAPGECNDYEFGSYAHKLEQKSEHHTGIAGQIAINERTPRERFTVGFGTAPGLGASQAAGLEHLLASLGRTERAFVALDSAYEPARQSRLVRLLDVPSVQRVPGDGRSGRFAVRLNLEAIETREV